jgi:hypothetical protein
MLSPVMVNSLHRLRAGADGSSETARPGTPLFANDQLASVGRSEARHEPVSSGDEKAR